MTDWRNDLPTPPEGFNWGIETGIINYLYLRSYDRTVYESEVISNAPNNFLEPFFMWLRTSQITDYSLRVTANRLLRKWEVRMRDREAERRWQ